jgi:proline iminopeptidase
MFNRCLRTAYALLLLLACSGHGAPPVVEGELPVSGGDSLYFRLVGRGTDTVVVLHGGPALNGRYMEEALRPLAESHVLLFYDQRGRGRSTAPQRPDSLSFAQDLEDLGAVQAHFALKPLRLIGHHWGAALAAHYAIRHPGQVARMVLLSPMPEQITFTFRLAYLPNDTAAVAAWNEARERHADSLDPAGFCGRFWGFQFSPAEVTAERVVRRVGPAICDESLDRLRARATTWRRLLMSLPGYDWSDSLAKALPPALVIVGGESAAWIANADQWSSRLHDARVLVLGRTALFPWVEAGDELNRQVDLFLGGSWPSEARRVDSLGHPITGL